MIEITEIKKRLKKIYKKVKNYREIADMIGINHTTIFNLINSKQDNINYKTWKKLSDYLTGANNAQ